MEKITLIIYTAIISVGISGCFSSGNSRIKNQTKVSIDKVIIKGKTTNAEILKKFDRASKIGPTLSGGEYWWYSYSQSVIDPISYTLANIIPEGSFYNRTSLMIEFSKEGIVSNYKFSKTRVQNPYFRKEFPDRD